MQLAYIRPRKLDKRVRIDTRSTGKGSSGGKTSSWTAGPWVWASISNLAGNEKKRNTHAGGGLAAVGVSTIEIRYRAGITAENTRLIRGETIYNIIDVDNVMEQNTRLVLTCQTGMNDG